MANNPAPKSQSPDPEAVPTLSAAELAQRELAELRAQVADLKMEIATRPGTPISMEDVQDTIIDQLTPGVPGNMARPTRGIMHPSGVPIFNSSRPTGRHG